MRYTAHDSPVRAMGCCVSLPAAGGLAACCPEPFGSPEALPRESTAGGQEDRRQAALATGMACRAGPAKYEKSLFNSLKKRFKTDTYPTDSLV